MMRNKNYLIIGGSLNLFIALVHLIAIFVGAPAYEFLDAPLLAFYSEMGSSFPAVLTACVTLFFLLFSVYAFFSAGSKVRLPMQKLFIKAIGWLFLFRGLALFWYIYLKVTNSPFASHKEIGFSLFALFIGILYLMGSSDYSLEKTKHAS